jgi:ADP-ribosylglycohydrolase
MQNRNHFREALLGVAVGDALGVPYEFLSRDKMKKKPATGMSDGGTWGQVTGTWSDDSSLTFCLAESLTHGFNLNDIAERFIRWKNEGYWTASGKGFDIGNTTKIAIQRLESGIKPEDSGETDINSNGNGSLMRILPLVFYLQDKTIKERFEITSQVSGITHKHNISVIACFYYLEFARMVIEGKDKTDIYNELKTILPAFLDSMQIPHSDLAVFDRLLKANIFSLDESEIKSKGYVLDTLEASIWCLLNSNDYPTAVLKAVNLGGDTDTTAAVTGGLAALCFGIDPVFESWLNELQKVSEIEELADKLKETKWKN